MIFTITGIKSITETSTILLVQQKEGVSIKREVTIPTSEFLKVLKSNFYINTDTKELAESYLKNNDIDKTIRLVINKSIKLDNMTQSGSRPNQYTATNADAADLPLPPPNNNVEWPSPDKTSPFTPINVPSNPDKDLVRIGYSLIKAPITYLSGSSQTFVNEVGALRQSNTIKTTSGQTYNNYTISYNASNPYEIDKYIKEVVEQISIYPFICCDGGPFGDRYELGPIQHKEIAVRSYTISTVPGFPNLITMQINFDPFIWDRWTPPTEKTDSNSFDKKKLDDAICYPLFKLWCKSESKSTFNPNRPFNGKLRFSAPTGNLLEKLASEKGRQVFDSTISDSLKAAYLGNFDQIKSDNVKEVRTLSSNKNFMVSVSSQEEFEILTGYKFNGTEFVGQFKGTYAGLIDKSKSSYKFADINGNRLKESGLIDVYGVPVSRESLNNPIYSSTTLADVIVSSSLSDAIENYLTDKFTAQLTPIYSDPELSERVTKKVQEILPSILKAPYNYFNILLQVTPDNDRFRQDLTQLSLLNQPESNSNLIDPTTDLTELLETNPTEIIIERITGGKSHNLSITNSKSDPLPIHQYIGSNGHIITIEGTCLSTSALNKIESIQKDFINAALKAKQSLFSATSETNTPFIVVDNEIFDLLGVNYVMPVGFNFQSVDGFPETYSFTMQFIEYNPDHKASEKLNLLSTYNQTNQETIDYLSSDSKIHPTVLQALDFFSLQGALKDYPVYPDLRLPSKSTVNRWISECREIADSYINGNTNLPSHLQFTQLHVDQFLNDPAFYYNRYLMSKWANQIESEGSSFVDPDFFYFYAANDSFLNLIDTVAQQTLGNRINYSGDPNSTTGSMRLIDTHYDVISVVGSDKLNASVSSGSNYLESIKENTFNLHDLEPATKLFEEEEAVKQQREQVGKALGWWISGSESIDAGEFKLVPVTDKAFLEPENSLIPFDSKSEESSVKDGNGLQEDEMQINEFPSSYHNFWNIGWRQKQLEKFAQKGWNSSLPITRYQVNDLTFGNFLLPAGDIDVHSWDITELGRFAYQGESAEVLFFEPSSNYTKTLQLNGFVPKFESTKYTWNGTKMTNLDQWSDYMFYAIPIRSKEGYLNTVQEFSTDLAESSIVNKLTPGGLNPIQDRSMPGIEPKSEATLRRKLSYLERVYLASNNLKKTSLTNPPEQFKNEGTITDRALENSRLFDFYAKKYQLDPNIIRAFFVVRSGFGTRKSLDSMQNDGWGDLDINLIKPDSTPEQYIDLFSKTFSKNLKEFKFPAYALIATDIQLTGKESKYYSTLDYKSLLRQGGKSLSSIQDTARRLPTSIELYDMYYAAWIECSRTVGAYFSSSTVSWYYDELFTPTNPAIVMDIGRNHENRSLVFNHSYSGSQIAVRAARNTIGNSVLSELQDKRIEDVSAEQQALLNNRQRLALFPTSEDAVYGMLHDMRRYSPHGRLVGAFPTYALVIINEGFYWQLGHEKLWDQYYTRTMVSSIEVFRSKDSPSHTASITLSNVFHQLTKTSAQELLLQNLSLEQKERIAKRLTTPSEYISTSKLLIQEFLFKDVSDEFKEIWARNYLNNFVLSPGARIHLRIGYGSNAAELPVVFNGTLVEAPVSQDSITLVCAGDGHELEKSSVNKLTKTQNGWFYKDTGVLFGSGKSPSNIVTEAMVNIESILPNITGGRFFRDWSHGISHFGDVYFDGWSHYPSEVAINIYDTSPTSFEQGIPAWRNLFDSTALYTWNGKDKNNWFSVSVSEPTPWKVIKSCTLAACDFVSSTEPIMTRSTLFYGKWWWPFNYAYKPSILSASFDYPKFQQEAKDLNEQFKNDSPFERGEKIRAESKKLIKEAEKALIADIERSPLIPGTDQSFVEERRPDYPGVGSLEQNARFSKLAVIDNYVSSYVISTESLINTPKRKGMTKYLGYIGYIYFELVDRQDFSKKQVIEVELYRDVIPFIATSVNLEVEIRSVGRGVTIAGLKSQTSVVNEGNTSKELFKDVDFLVSHMYWKPFCQAHLVTSELNLLSNNIVTSSAQVFTDAMAQYTYNGMMSSDAFEKTSSWCVDDDIEPSQRKTLMVDSGLHVTALQSGLPGVARRIVQSSFVSWLPGFNELIGKTPPTPGVGNSVLNALTNSVKEMYQGWLLVSGIPSLKPYDILSFRDDNSGLAGPLWVGEVIHRFDGQTGYVTFIKPDCVATPQTAFQGQRIISAIAPNVLAQLSALWTIKMIGISSKHKLKMIFSVKDATKLDKLIKARGIGLQIIKSRGISNQRSEALDFLNSMQRYNEFLSTEDKDRLNSVLNIVESGEDLPESFDSEINKLISSLAKIPEKIKKTIGRNLPIEQIDEIDQLVSKTDVSITRYIKLKSLLDPISKIQESWEIQERHIEEFKKSLFQNAKKFKLDTIQSPEKLEEAIDSLIADEWVKWYNKNETLIEAAGFNKVDANDLINVLTSKLDDVVSTYGKNSKEYKSILKAIKILEEKPGDQDVSISDIKKLINLDLGEVWDPTLKNKSVLDAIIEANAPYGEAIRKTGKIPSNIISRFKSSQEIAGDLSPTTKLWNSVKNTKNKLKELKETGLKLEDLSEEEKAAKALIRQAKLAKKVEQTEDFAKGVITAARIGAYNPYTLPLALAKDVLMLSVGNSIVDGINNHLKSRQAVKIYPLMSGGIPWVAGIRGHQGAVVGDDPGWLDRWITASIAGPGPGRSSSAAFMASSIFASIFGLEVPNYYKTPADEAYLKSLQK